MNITVGGYRVRRRYGRRRYGRQWYCWVEVEGKSLGDPWPCRTPKAKELLAAYHELLTWEQQCQR